MIVGFTGSRAGMTARQRLRMLRWLNDMEPTEAHHGDCIGADAEFHEICGVLGVPVVLHPPADATQRAFCQGAVREEAPLPYLDRNKAIVAACDVLLAAPKEATEQPRGGTWATIRHARKVGRALKVAAP